MMVQNLIKIRDAKRFVMDGVCQSMLRSLQKREGKVLQEERPLMFLKSLMKEQVRLVLEKIKKLQNNE